MTEIQRNQLGRHELGDAGSTRIFRPSARGHKFVIGYMMVAVAILGALTYAAVQAFDGWHHAIVLADMVVIFFGIAAWNYSERKHA
ncbi:MAG: hypothetical protein ACR2G3_01935 [Solirubrobacterales bacterium]